VISGHTAQISEPHRITQGLQGTFRNGEEDARRPSPAPRPAGYAADARPLREHRPAGSSAKALSTTNPHAIPRLEKIVVNMGVGVAVTEKKFLGRGARRRWLQVTGQKPVATLSKAAVSGFKLRENLPIGCKVTLRGRRMYEFFDRLVSLGACRGFATSAACRARHSTAMAITASAFPSRWCFRRSTRTSARVLGMNITFVTTARTDDDAREFYVPWECP